MMVLSVAYTFTWMTVYTIPLADKLALFSGNSRQSKAA